MSKERRIQKGVWTLTCIRERTTWYGYVDVSAISLLAPDIIVYAVLDQDEL